MFVLESVFGRGVRFGIWYATVVTSELQLRVGGTDWSAGRHPGSNNIRFLFVFGDLWWLCSFDGARCGGTICDASGPYNGRGQYVGVMPSFGNVSWGGASSGPSGGCCGYCGHRGYNGYIEQGVTFLFVVFFCRLVFFINGICFVFLVVSS